VITDISVSSADLFDASGPALGLRGAFPFRSEAGIEISLERGKENKGRAEDDEQDRHQQQRPHIARKIRIPPWPIHHEHIRVRLSILRNGADLGAAKTEISSRWTGLPASN
jgi:hypothetical protein